MGKKIMIRAIGMTMSILLCLCAVSCTRPKETEGIETQRLTVESADAEYTSTFCAVTAEQSGALFGRLLALCGGPVLTQAQQQSIQNQIQERILPQLESLSVYPYELDALLEKTQELCTYWENNEGVTPSALFLQFYQSGLSVMPSQKLGSILFSYTDLYLNHKAQQCYERYEAYGYQWYLDDAHRYADLLTQLRSTVGGEVFSQMVTLAVFGLTLGAGAAQEESRLYALSDEELTVLLARQAEYFSCAEISQEQWGSAAQIYTALFTPQGDTLLDAELSALFRSGYGGQIAKCMPALLQLYRSVASKMTPQQLSALRRGDESTAPLTAAQLLRASSAEMLALEKELDRYGFCQSKEEEGVLRNAGLWEDYQQYLADTPTVQTDVLLKDAAAYALTPNQESREVFLNSARYYLRTYLPCLAFVLSHSQA